jgi:hypothetical protein
MSLGAVRSGVREGRFRVVALTVLVPGWTVSAVGGWPGAASIGVGLLAVVGAAVLAGELGRRARRPGDWARSDTANAMVLAAAAFFLGVSLLAWHASTADRTVAMIFSPLYAAAVLGYAGRRRPIPRPPESP